MFFEPTDLLWWKILAEAYNPNRGYMLLILVIVVCVLLVLVIACLNDSHFIIDHDVSTAP